MKEIDKYINKIYRNMNTKSKDIEDLKNEMKEHLINEVGALKSNGYSEKESIEIAIEKFGKIDEIEDELDEVTDNTRIKFNNVKKITALVIFITYVLIVVYIKFMDTWGRESLLMTKELVKENPELLKNILNLVPFRGMNTIAVIRSIIANTIIFIPLGYFISKMKLDKIKLPLILIILIGIEMIQYIFSLGIANINDIIFGFLGSLIGILINSNKFLKVRSCFSKRVMKKINKVTSINNR